MLRKLTVLAVVLAVLMTASAPLVLAQQGESVTAPSDLSVQEAGGGSGVDCPPPGDPRMLGPCTPGTGFVQYDNALPSGTVDCPPPTEPRMLRPCFVGTG